MKIKVFKYQDLGQERLYEILKLRLEVFVVEQKCAYQDLDNKDEKALHLVGEENNKIIAYTRIFRKGDFFKSTDQRISNKKIKITWVMVGTSGLVPSEAPLGS